MTRLRRKIGLALALSALAIPASAGVQDDFQEGVQLLRRGRTQEALAAFQRALAADPTNQEAYDLWKQTDEQIFVEMLVAGGEFQKIAKRFLERARLGRTARRNDASAIGDLVNRLRSTGDVMERRGIIRTLSAEHGEYAVPRLIRPLGESGDEDWRIIAMHTLTEMDSDVVLPLVQALTTENAYQRANVAMVLGYIGDPRAAAALDALAQTDSESRVVRAAQRAAARCAASGDPLAEYLRLGEDYHYRRTNVLRASDYSDVAWSWADGDLVPSGVPRAIYNNELSKAAYYAALALDPSSLDALAGIARASSDEVSKLEALSATGVDVDDLLERAREGELAVAAAGVDAIDRALHWSVITDDSSTGVRLCRILAELAGGPTDGLEACLDSTDGALSGEAAAALGRIAARGAADPGAWVVAALGANAGRDVVRIAAVIDGDGPRAASMVEALTQRGVLVNHRGSGTQGIALLHRLPGIDVILVGDRLPDLTVDQVLADAAGNPVTMDTPVFLVTADADMADAYSDRVGGTLTGAADIASVEAHLNDLSGDRARADDLSRRSAEVLADLAAAGNSDLAGVLGDLGKTLAHRGDAVTIPAMQALGAAGTPDQIAALVAVVADDGRSDEARAAAAGALAGIFGRYAASADSASALREVLTSDAPIGVRAAVARALGRAGLDGAARASLLQDVRVDVHDDQ